MAMFVADGKKATDEEGVRAHRYPLLCSVRNKLVCVDRLPLSWFERYNAFKLSVFYFQKEKIKGTLSNHQTASDFFLVVTIAFIYSICYAKTTYQLLR